MNLRQKVYFLTIVLALSVGLQACNKEVSQQTAQEHQHDHGHPEHGQPDEHTAEHEHGTSQEYQWKITVPSQPYQTGQETTIAWELRDKDNNLPVRNLEVTHEKTSHLIIVSKDLGIFQHLHPDVVGPGKLQVKTDFPKAGEYVLFFQFTTPDKGEQLLRTKLKVDGKQRTISHLKPDSQVKTVDGYTFKLGSYPTKANANAELTFHIEKDGKPVKDIQPYLGAGGHAVIINKDTSAFLHAHPQAEAEGGFYRSPVTFHTLAPEPGMYKAWGQFQLNGKVQTVDFTFEVK